MSRPDGSAELQACLLVWCSEHGIAVDADYVGQWLDQYWLNRFDELDQEAQTAAQVAGPPRVCRPGARCLGLLCPVCSGN